MQLTQRKSAEDLPTVGEDKVRSWQERQNTDNNTEGKEKIVLQQNSVCNEKDDPDQLSMASAATSQEASKKTKRKKAKNKKIVESELENGEKGNRLDRPKFSSFDSGWLVCLRYVHIPLNLPLDNLPFLRQFPPLDNCPRRPFPL